MKNITINCFFLLFVTLPSWSFAQCSSPFGVNLNSQAQIDNFVANNPGCTQVLGSLSITGNDNTNLNGLSGITSVGGLLSIQNNPLLTNLTGLSGLISVGDLVVINQNATLTNLTGISNLNSVGGNVEISYNPMLTSVGGLSGLRSIGGGLSILQNQSLVNLSGIRLGTAATIKFLTIEWNVSLTSLGNNSVIHYVTDDVKIHYNPLLANFGSWLTSLQSVGRNLTIDNNQSLQNLDGLVELKKVTLGMFITYNKVLTSIVGVSRAAVGSGLLILECDALTIIPVFTQISSFKGVLQVTECDALTSVAGFAGVTSLKSLVITRNKSLTSLAPFSTLTGSIGTNNIGSDHLAIGECPLLTDLTGLDNITAVGGQLAIDNNISLTNINALSKISTVVATVFITRNKVLQNVNGLSGLTSIGASLDISDNTALTSVTGLSNLTSLGGAYATLFVISNPALTSLQGLQNIDPTTIKDLYLRASPNLSVCELPNICTYLSNPANPSSIYGNAANCVSRAAIQAICPVPTTTSISGKVYREDNADIQNANLKLVGGSNVYTATTDINGDYTFSNIPIGTTYTLKVSKTNDSPLNGISIADMFKMMQHNLNITLLSSPYKMIAADVNNDGSIDATDMLHMQNFILSISQAIPAGGWIFIPSDYVFPNPTNPFSSNYPQSKTITLTSALSNINFIGLRRGDVNDTAITKP